MDHGKKNYYQYKVAMKSESSNLLSIHGIKEPLAAEQAGNLICNSSDNIQACQVARNSRKNYRGASVQLSKSKERFPPCKSKNENFRSKVFVAFPPAVCSW